MKPQSIMLDLETLGSGNDAAIIAIGAVKFDPRGNGTGEEFYEVIDLEISSHPGEMNPGTVLWWLTQDEDARRALTHPSNTVPMGEALLKFTKFARGCSELWSNGPTFDETILNSAYRRYMIERPMPFRASRCCRTIFNLRPKDMPRREKAGVAHNALDDSIKQALDIQEIYKVRGL